MTVTAEPTDQQTPVIAVVRAEELVRALNNTLLAVSKDETLPTIAAVHIKWCDGQIALTATDRYMIIRECLDLVDDGDGDGAILLPVRDVKNLITVIGKNPEPGPVTLRVSGGELITSTSVTTMRTHLVLDPDQFPNIASYFPDWADEPRDYSHLALAPAFLARLGKLRTDQEGAAVHFQTGTAAHKPVAFRLGSQLSGIVMPIRIAT